MCKIILSAMVLLFIVSTGFSWYEDYAYRTKIEITNSYNFQIINEKATITVPVTNIRGDCHDVALRLSDTVNAQYWTLDSCSSSSVTISIYANILSEQTLTYYLYYSNPSDSAIHYTTADNQYSPNNFYINTQTVDSNCLNSLGVTYYSVQADSGIAYKIVKPSSMTTGNFYKALFNPETTWTSGGSAVYGYSSPVNCFYSAAGTDTLYSSSSIVGTGGSLLKVQVRDSVAGYTPTIFRYGFTKNTDATTSSVNTGALAQIAGVGWEASLLDESTSPDEYIIWRDTIGETNYLNSLWTNTGSTSTRYYTATAEGQSGTDAKVSLYVISNNATLFYQQSGYCGTVGQCYINKITKGITTLAVSSNIYGREYKPIPAPDINEGSITSAASYNAATIIWNTDIEPDICTVTYSVNSNLNDGYNVQGTESYIGGLYPYQCSVSLSGLTNNTQYYYRIIAGKFGQYTYYPLTAPYLTFTTEQTPAPSDFTPPSINSWFPYGETTNSDSIIIGVIASDAQNSVTGCAFNESATMNYANMALHSTLSYNGTWWIANITDLDDLTNYNYYVKCVDSVNNTMTSSQWIYFSTDFGTEEIFNLTEAPIITVGKNWAQINWTGTQLHNGTVYYTKESGGINNTFSNGNNYTTVYSSDIDIYNDSYSIYIPANRLITDINITFDMTSDAVTNITLRAGNYTGGWNFSDYINNSVNISIHDYGVGYNDLINDINAYKQAYCWNIGCNIPLNISFSKEDPYEYILNGGFESGTGTNPDNWDLDNVRNSTEYHSGSYSAGGSNYVMAINQSFSSCVSNYTVTFWAKGGNNVSLFIDDINVYNTVTSTEWKKYMFSSSACARNISLELYNYVVIDDVSLRYSVIPQTSFETTETWTYTSASRNNTISDSSNYSVYFPPGTSSYITTYPNSEIKIKNITLMQRGYSGSFLIVSNEYPSGLSRNFNITSWNEESYSYNNYISDYFRIISTAGVGHIDSIMFYPEIISQVDMTVDYSYSGIILTSNSSEKQYTHSLNLTDLDSSTFYYFWLDLYNTTYTRVPESSYYGFKTLDSVRIYNFAYDSSTEDTYFTAEYDTNEIVSASYKSISSSTWTAITNISSLFSGTGTLSGSIPDTTYGNYYLNITVGTISKIFLIEAKPLLTVTPTYPINGTIISCATSECLFPINFTCSDNSAEKWYRFNYWIYGDYVSADNKYIGEDMEDGVYTMTIMCNNSYGSGSADIQIEIERIPEPIINSATFYGQDGIQTDISYSGSLNHPEYNSNYVALFYRISTDNETFITVPTGGIIGDTYYEYPDSPISVGGLPNNYLSEDLYIKSYACMVTNDLYFACSFESDITYLPYTFTNVIYTSIYKNDELMNSSVQTVDGDILTFQLHYNKYQSDLTYVIDNVDNTYFIQKSGNVSIYNYIGNATYTINSQIDNGMLMVYFYDDNKLVAQTGVFIYSTYAPVFISLIDMYTYEPINTSLENQITERFLAKATSYEGDLIKLSVYSAESPYLEVCRRIKINNLDGDSENNSTYFWMNYEEFLFNETALMDELLDNPFCNTLGSFSRDLCVSSMIRAPDSGDYLTILKQYAQAYLILREYNYAENNTATQTQRAIWAMNQLNMLNGQTASCILPEGNYTFIAYNNRNGINSTSYYIIDRQGTFQSSIDTTDIAPSCDSYLDNAADPIKIGYLSCIISDKLTYIGATTTNLLKLAFLVAIFISITWLRKNIRL